MGKTGKDLTVNIMMVGGRRCGKTSVLAAMQSCFEEQLSGTPLFIGADDYEMMDIIEAKQQEMRQYFLEQGKNRDFIPDNLPTEEISEYPFYVGIKDKSSRIHVNFIDYPGEWLGEKDHLEDLHRRMEQSRILLIAIDTPHLMEQKGLYNDPRNRCRRVTEMIKKAGFADANKGAGMVLFVPLKCERYYNRNQMGEVCAKVQEVYKPLLQYLQQPGAGGGSSRITIAVTPILTLGGAEFSRFYREDGEIVLDKWGTPTKAIYHFYPDMGKDAPEPKFCEQPLLYMLAYVIEQARRAREEQKNSGNIFTNFVLTFFQTSILKWASADDWLRQAQAVDGQLKQDGSGYCILSKGDLKKL